MIFSFVDSITECEPGVSAKGFKHVTANDKFVGRNRHNRWVLIPSMVAEALGQLAAWNIMAAVDFSRRPIAGIAQRIEVHDFVELGETLELAVSIKHYDDKAVQYHAEAMVGARSVMTITNALGPMVEQADFADADAMRHQFAVLFNPHRPPVDLRQSASFAPLSPPHAIINESFDSIIDLGSECLSACKKITYNAEFLAEHFPRKPVYPMTLLIHAKTQLCIPLLQQYYPGIETGCQYCEVRLSKLKMKDFLAPGDLLMAEAVITSRSEHALTFRITGKRQEQLISTAEIVFDLIRLIGD